MKMVRRWRPLRDGPAPNVSFVADVRTFDIPETIGACVRAASSHPCCVGVTLRPLGGSRMIKAAERAARRGGIRILWVPTWRCGG